MPHFIRGYIGFFGYKGVHRWFRFWSKILIFFGFYIVAQRQGVQLKDRKACYKCYRSPPTSANDPNYFEENLFFDQISHFLCGGTSSFFAKNVRVHRLFLQKVRKVKNFSKMAKIKKLQAEMPIDWKLNEVWHSSTLFCYSSQKTEYLWWKNGFLILVKNTKTRF